MNGKTPTVNEPITEEPLVEQSIVEEASVEQVPAEPPPVPQAERTWSEEINLAGSQLVEAVKHLIAEGNVRRLILRTPDGSLVLEIPLMAGAVIGGVVTVFAPLLAVLGAVASVLAHVKVEVVRVEEPAPKE